MNALPPIPAPLAMTDEEREVLVPGPKLSVVEWATRHRVLDAKTSALHGRWSWEITPFLVELAEAWCDPTVRMIILCKCSQSAGTELANNILGRTADQDRAPTLVVMPVAKDVRRRIRTRIAPMFQNCPALMDRLGGDIRNLRVGEETALDGMLLYLGWATSPAALADNPVCYVLLDEVDKYPARVGKEADPISLAAKRQRTFPNAKTFIASTPTDEAGPVTREFNAGDRREYWVPCSHCGSYQVMTWIPGVELDKTPEGYFLTAGEYEAGGRARYRCRECRRGWTEGDRWAAVCAGVWCPDGCSVGRDGRIRGKIPATSHRSYRVTAMMLHPAFQSIDNLAAEWARAEAAKRAGDWGPRIDFFNSQLAEPWSQTVIATAADKLAEHIDELDQDVVPAEAVVLTAGVDVQLDHVYLDVYAWGYLYECWLVRSLRIDTGPTDDLRNWEALTDALAVELPRFGGEGDPMAIRLTLVDSGYRTHEVYHYCRTYAGGDIRPTKGAERMPQALRPSRIDYSPRTGRIAPGSIVLWHVNTTYFKDRAAGIAANEQTGPGFMHLPADTTDEWLAQFTAEAKRVIPKGRGRNVHAWVTKKGGEPHRWDTFVLALAAADMVGVRNIRPAGAPAAPKPRRRVRTMKRFADR